MLSAPTGASEPLTSTTGAELLNARSSKAIERPGSTSNEALLNCLGALQRCAPRELAEPTEMPREPHRPNAEPDNPVLYVIQ